MKNSSFKLDFVCIGAEKAGTTWLADMLAQHPRICVSEPKEVHYFNRKPAFIWGELNPKYDRDSSWYIRHFKHCKPGQLCGEFSTHYIWDGKAPERVKEFAPDVKIIACLRDPISRAYSQYWMYKDFLAKETAESFEEAIKQHSEYLEKGLYFKQLSRYLKLFGRDQILILFLEDIAADPAGVLKKTLDFMGLDRDFKFGGLEDKSNSSKKIIFKPAFTLMKFTSNLLISLNLSWLSKALKRMGFKALLMKASTKNVKYPKIETKTRERLIKYFIRDIEQLEKLTDRDLTKWKTV